MDKNGKKLLRKNYKIQRTIISGNIKNYHKDKKLLA